MATEFKDNIAFSGGLSIVGQLSMSAIGQAGLGYEGWSLSNLSAATGTTTVDASSSPALATLVAQLVRRGVITGTGSGF